MIIARIPQRLTRQQDGMFDTEELGDWCADDGHGEEMVERWWWLRRKGECRFIKGRCRDPTERHARLLECGGNATGAMLVVACERIDCDHRGW